MHRQHALFHNTIIGCYRSFSFDIAIVQIDKKKTEGKRSYKNELFLPRANLDPRSKDCLTSSSRWRWSILRPPRTSLSRSKARAEGVACSLSLFFCQALDLMYLDAWASISDSDRCSD